MPKNEFLEQDGRVVVSRYSQWCSLGPIIEDVEKLAQMDLYSETAYPKDFGS